MAKSKIRYDHTLLEKIIKRDECKIPIIPEKLNRDTRIKFICKCGCDGKKNFRTLNEKTGCFCKVCTENIRQAKKRKTNLKKYGVENPMQSQEVKEKSKKTNLKKYGVEHAFQSQEVKEKYKKTNLKKYGVEHAMQSQEVKEKSKKTCMENHGVEHPFQSQEVKEKSKKTNLKKYGVENPMHNSEISEKASKNAYKLKDYTLPSSKVIKIQGAENHGLDYYFNNLEGTEDNLITSRIEVPEIWYTGEDNKRHRYFCDFYIKNTNTIVEIKSMWTYEKNKIKVELTKKECENQNYNFLLLIFDGKGKLI
jgi:hypothetical protein